MLIQSLLDSWGFEQYPYTPNHQPQKKVSNGKHNMLQTSYVMFVRPPALQTNGSAIVKNIAL